MAIFNYKYTESLLEMKTKEEYRRRSFKKKYNFEPDKPGSNTGTITTKDGKKYKLDMRKGIPYTGANTMSPDSDIRLDKTFFKLKGSNKSERRDSTLNHEIGHQNLHNIHPDNTTVDKKNRTDAVLVNRIEEYLKNKRLYGIQVSYDEKRSLENLGNGYIKTETNDKKEQKKRDDALNAAQKYANDNKHHQDVFEYEADRFAANRTSDSAVKRGIRNTYKYTKKMENDKKSNKITQDDMKQRSKALKDKDLRKSDVYK